MVLAGTQKGTVPKERILPAPHEQGTGFLCSLGRSGA